MVVKVPTPSGIAAEDVLDVVLPRGSGLEEDLRTGRPQLGHGFSKINEWECVAKLARSEECPS